MVKTIFTHSEILRQKTRKRWLGLLSFCLMLFMGQMGFAQYCMPSSSNANYEYITNVTFAGINNTTEGNTGLNNYTSQTATVYKDLIGEEYTLSVSIEADSNEYVYVFIDWNQNGVLNDSGEVYVLASGTSANGPFTTQVTVPAEAVLGSTRMRVILNWNSTPTPCTSPSYGEIEDYTVTVLGTPPACPAPTALTAEVTANSATLGWIGTGNFDIKWGASGFDVETEGTLVAGASNPYNLGGLTTGVSYQFYVRQDCDGDFSDWVGPFSFVPNNFKVIGAGASNTNGTGNDPIDDFYSSMRYQTVYTAAELTAAGFVAYNELTGLGFSVSEGTNTALLNYQIRIGHTTASNAGAHIDSPDLITVRNPASYLPTVVGVDEFDMLTFDTNFVWNGVDNIVIDICTGGSNPYSAPYGGVRSHSLTNGSRFVRADTSASQCSVNTSTTNSNRPQIQFSFIEGTPPACPAPAGLSATNLTSNSADLAWISDGTAFDIKWGAAGFDVETEGTLEEDFVSGATLSGLDSITAYQFYVRQDCGGEVSDWAGPYTFTTLCEAVSALNENFDSTTTPNLPECWGKIVDNGASIYATITTTTTNSSSPNGVSLYNSDSSSSSNIILVSPVLSNLDAGTHWLRFSGRNSTASQDIVIGTLSDPTDGSTFTPFETVDLTTTFAEYTVDFSAYSGTDTYIGFRRLSTSTYTYVYLDDIVWEEKPSCVFPLDLTATNLTSNSADLGWTSDGEQFDIKWGEPGFDVETEGTLEEGFANGGTLSGLNPQTTYQFYVRNNCGGDLSVWAGPFGFTTLCAPEVAPTAVQSFSDFTTTAPNPACWSEATGAVTANSTLTGTTSKWAGGSFGNTGSNTSARINLYGTSSDWLMSQQIDLGSTPGAFRVKYDMAVTPYSGTTAQSTLGSHIVRVIVSTDGGATWSVNNTVKTYTGVGSYSNTGQTETVNLSEYSGVVKIAFVATTSSYSPDVYFFIDNFLVEEIPSCLEPTDLTATNITSNSADLSWTSDGENFEISWGEGNFDPEDGTIVSFSNGGTLSGLNSSATHRFYVRQVCSAEENSVWAGPFSFTTLLANDNIEEAIPVECGGTYTGSTATATNDQPNPAIFGVAATLSPNVWYSYTGSGEPELITASLCNSGFDTSILIATGTPGNLTWIAGNEDFCGTNGWRSQVEFASDGTTTYYIMVRGFGATTTGTYELVITCQEACSPATTNDEVADAEIVILGTPLATNNTCATSSPQSYPTCGSQYATYYDTWYSFNSGNSNNINILITPEAETTVVGFAVYSGTEGNLTQVACNILGASTNFNVTPNTNYYVRAYSTSPSAKGNFTLSVSSNCITGEWVGNTSSSWTTASNWCANITPTTLSNILIKGGRTNYPVITSNVTIGSLTVENGASLTVNSNNTLTVGAINVENGGQVIFKNNAILLQEPNTVNSGNVTIQREHTLKHLDYTVWSSPVIGQNIHEFSPNTLTSRIYEYFDGNWTNTDVSLNFIPGKGYMFRAPNVFDEEFYPNAYTWTGSFVGTPQTSATITTIFPSIASHQGVGNPYPTPIDLEEFYIHNMAADLGSVYLWCTDLSEANRLNGDNAWATFNLIAGGVHPADGPQPNGIIGIGQGFVVRVRNNVNSIQFTTDMRTGAAPEAFYRTSNIERHRLWLNLAKEESVINQALVAYVEGATQGFDPSIDAEAISNASSALYSLIPNNPDNFVIQGRALPFNDLDVVPMGFRAAQAGTYTISLAKFDGVFAEGQDIFLVDNLNQVTHNLKETNYTFVSEAGEFNSRFSVVYRQDALSVTNPDLNNNWVVYPKNGQFQIETNGFEMKQVIVYDMLGRTVYQSNAEGNNHLIDAINANQVLIVKVVTTDDVVLTKKVNN